MNYFIKIDGYVFRIKINYWTGKKSVYYDDLPLELKNGCFEVDENKFFLTGNCLAGIYLSSATERRKIFVMAFYEFVFAMLAVVCSIGGIGGFVIGIIGLYINLCVAPYLKNTVLRILVMIGISVMLFFLMVLFACIYPPLFGLEWAK